MTGKKGRSRERITDVREAEIITLIDDWDPKRTEFTREALVRRIKCKMDITLSRQGLMRREAIRSAFLRREDEINGARPALADKEPLTAILERKIEELQAKVTEKDKVIASYKELFLTYRYNARQLGITAEQLRAPIPSRNRSEGSRG